MWHNIFIALVGLAMLFLGFIVGLCVTAKRTDNAIAKTLRETTTDPEEFKKWMGTWEAQNEPIRIRDCVRPLPHICKVNGPCNGYPSVKWDNQAMLKKEK